MFVGAVSARETFNTMYLVAYSVLLFDEPFRRTCGNESKWSAAAILCDIKRLFINLKTIHMHY